MKPVDQQFTHQPEIGQHGDCFRAVIASLLELSIDQVPHFFHDGCDADVFYQRANAFLAEHGLCYVAVPSFDTDVILGCFGVPELFHEIAGKSPRGVMHSVVGRNGQIVHDPHPSRDGLIDHPSQWQFGLLVRLNRGTA